MGSTMHEFFAPRHHVGPVLYSGDTIHTEYVTIPGATTDQVRNAFRIDFIDTIKKPMDVLVICGYNDLVRGFPKEQIIRSLDRFATEVILHSVPGHPPNTCAIASMLYPPQLAWFPDNGPPPSPNYVNKKNKIDWINNEIDHVN